MLTQKERKFLLEAAREAMLAYPEKTAPALSGALAEKSGVFVSLHAEGELRGCIGHILPVKQLGKAVTENAISAAYHDHRFQKPTKDELKKMEVEISILTDPVRIDYTGPEQLLTKLDNAKGIILRKGLCTATFLPQVWEQLPEKTEFLAHLCLKAGLEADEWQSSYAEIYLYTADVFSSEKG